MEYENVNSVGQAVYHNNSGFETKYCSRCGKNVKYETISVSYYPEKDICSTCGLTLKEVS